MIKIFRFTKILQLPSGKACQGQAIELTRPICKFWRKKSFMTLVPAGPRGPVDVRQGRRWSRIEADVGDDFAGNDELRPMLYKTFYGRDLRFFIISCVFARLSWKSLPGTNALAFYKKAQLTAVKSVISLTVGQIFFGKAKSLPWRGATERCSDRVDSGLAHKH